MTYKRIDPAVIDYLSDFDLSLFVTEADGFLEDLKRNTTGSFYTPIEWVRYMTKISVSDWIVETLKTHKVKAPAQPTQWVLALAKKYDEGEWQSGMEVFKSLSMSEEELTILLNAFENIRVIDIACGAGAFLLEFVELLTTISTNMKKILGQETDYKTHALDFLTDAVAGIDLQPEPLAVYILCLMWRYASLTSGCYLP